MLIHVRRRHIEAGHRASSMNCPIALAAYELAGASVAVLTSVMRIGDITYMLPRNARLFIARFDAGKPVKPFAFTLK